MPKFPPRYFKEASDVDAFLDPQNPAFGQISVTAQGEIFQYRLSREAMAILHRRIGDALDEQHTRGPQ